MAHTLIVSAAQALYAQSTTISFAPLGVAFNGGTPDTTETDTQIVQRTAGVLSKLSANCTTNGATVISLHKNASATGITETITIGGTGITTDSTHTDAVTAGDKWNYTLSAVAATFSLFSNVFAATSNTACRLVTFANPAITLSGTGYDTLVGEAVAPVVAVTQAQMTIEKTGTFQFLAVNMSANGAAANSFVRTAKGGTPTAGNCSITLNGAGTGILEDTSHQDTVTAGDLWVKQLLWAGGTTTSYFSTALDYITTTGDSIQGNGFTSNVGQVKSLTRFYAVGGEVSTASVDGTEASLQDTTQDAYVYSNTFVNCFNFIAAGDTIQLRANSAQADSISVSPAGSGQTGDTTHTYTAATTDTVDFQVVTGATTGTRKFSAIWTHAHLATGTAAIIYPNFYDTRKTHQMEAPRPTPYLSNLPPIFIT